MKVKGQTPEKTTIKAKIIRKDGTIEDLGKIDTKIEGNNVIDLLRRLLNGSDKNRLYI